jgi:iron(III) transport system substrate-binding protein
LEHDPRIDGASPALAALTLAALPLLAACGDGRTPLVLYSPHGREILEPLEERYEELNPLIDVRWLDMGSQDVFDRIRSEAANPQADIWFGGPHTIFLQGAALGLLEAYTPSWAGAVPPEAADPDGLHWGVYRAVPVLVYNGDAVPEQDAPRDWDDLLEPRWQGRIILRDPLASGTMRTIFGMVLARSVVETGSAEAGFEWLCRLDSQTKEYVFSPALLFEKLTRREAEVSMWELTDILLLQDKGSPLRYRFAASGLPVITDAIGLVRGARHAEEAQSFIDWVGEEEALLLVLERSYRLPARQDLPVEKLPAWAREALEELRPAEVDWRLIELHGAEWMARWDREIRGRGRL